MANLKVLADTDVQKLKDRLKTKEGISAYRKEPFLLGDATLLDSAITVVDQVPELPVPEGRPLKASSDLDNSIRVYEWLGPLDEVTATDSRLWVHLTHTLFHHYSIERWPLPEEEDKAYRHISSHWFVQGRGLGALRRNSVARLWWAVHLTRAPWERDVSLGSFKSTDPYVYTRVLLANQDVYQGLLERDFGVNLRTLTAMLEVIRRDPANRATSPFATAITKTVNLQSAYRELAMVPFEALVTSLEKTASEMEANRR
ncbi:DUF6339 family protein [Myxococcus landrumensis]|uniref:Uncharacterized protein n=1 Tax=Myxococcus landrumensis TaxID=2813577 RepID=A0ABX7N0J1_9BACT|nr:DUF6339 family protein [Myxococcus landrumus]QSQ11215.1 hypothetical protein JY572_22620 [Myxococcus landrumus]